MTKFLMILGNNGKVLILDQNGDFVSTVARQGSFFTTLGTAGDKLLLGTDRGTIQVYHVSSLQFVTEIPYQFALLPSKALNHSQHKSAESTVSIESALQKAGPHVTSIELTENQRFMKVAYGDRSFAVIDRMSNTIN